MNSPRSVSRERHLHPVSSPSLLIRLWTSVLPESLSTAKGQTNGLKRRMTRKTLVKKPKNKPHRLISPAPHHAAADFLDADWHDVGQMTKDMPPDYSTLPPQRRVKIDMLPKDALLVIFDFYLNDPESTATLMKGEWHTLVHVCQKWRNVVVSSPQRLNLRLCCTPWKSAKKMLDIWPRLPVVINHFGLTASEWGMDNLITALEHNDRVCQIALRPIPGWQWENFMSAMSHPFPALTHLRLKSDDERETTPAAPDSFLGGSTPRLQFLWLERIPFPGLPKLLLSTTDLVDLRLWEVPNSGYISPESMANCLSALMKLERLDLEFQSAQSCPNRESQRPPLSTRFVLPALTRFWFRGSSEYLEDLVARIDTPLLHGLFIGFFHKRIFDTPQLAQFISRTPTLMQHNNKSQVLCFSDWGASVICRPVGTSDTALQLGILCGQSADWQLSSLAQICTSSFPNGLIPTVERLSVVEETVSPPHWQEDDITKRRWLELLRPFTAVQKLYLSRESAPRIAPCLQELVGGRAMEVLPALRKLFLEETRPPIAVRKAMKKFIEARRPNHPITMSQWKREGSDGNGD